ncbi:g5353 [Coccomyxa elongata]
MQLLFEEMQEGAGPGPFEVQTMLKDADGEILYRPGIGTARAKKDAKQLAAAALLELLLETVPFPDLLYKSEKQQQLKDWQVPVTGATSASV